MSSSSTAAFLRSGVDAGYLKLGGITPSASDLFMKAVTGCRNGSMHFFTSQVGSGSKSSDLFGELEIISFISLAEAG